MKLLTHDDIKQWANRYDSKSKLPLLILRLVRATTHISTKADFPSDSAVFTGGWDGIVDCKEDTAYVPNGISLWELSTEKSVLEKANQDYNKRTSNPLDYTPKDCVFIFVTAQFWKVKKQWVKSKKEECIWKDVKAYDSVDLEQWLGMTLPVSRWFSSQVGNYPFDGIMTADEFWEEWSLGPNSLDLKPEVVTSGREYEQEQLLNILQEPPSIKGVKASTKNEAIAFIIATAKQFPKNDSDYFFSKSLIIDNEGNFRGIRINTITPLNLIPRFEDTQPLYSAVSNGHHVLIPLGGDDTFNQETIILSTIDRNGQINSLVESGVSRENAEKFSREAGRNITILKKLLGYPYTKVKWIEKENIREIIPALLLGRWDENFVGDIEIIEKLSGQTYSEYTVTLIKWLNLEESPLIQIGNTWRLTSPLDLWTNISSHLVINDFDNLEECFSLAYKNGKQIIEPESQNDYDTPYDKKTKFSAWSREGLAQSLILVGHFGKGLNISKLSNPQLWVDRIIHDLLYDATGELWFSVDHELPLLSEASPKSFIKAVSNSLLKEQPEIMNMFNETEGFLHSTCNHAGLLWSLEGLAWMPEYLLDVSLILLKLSRLDPGGSYGNRPVNSINEIFKPWHYQTLASYKERMEILKTVTQKEPESGWNLLIDLLPENHEIAHPTHKMRWRIFDKNTNLSYTNAEFSSTLSYVISLLFDIFDGSENKFAQLIDESVKLPHNERRKVFDWAEKKYPEIKQSTFTSWHVLRKILYNHRSHPDANWALPESELEKYEILYKKLKPKNALNRNIWIFNESRPNFPEGFKHNKNDYKKSYEQYQEKVNNERVEAIKSILTEVGLKGTVKLRKSVKEPGILGYALAKIITKENDILAVLQCLKDNKNNLKFIQGFIFGISVIKEFEGTLALFRKLQDKGFSNVAQGNFLVPLEQSRKLWEFISTLNKDIQLEYWHNVNPGFNCLSDKDKIYGIQMLMKHKRYSIAIDSCYFFAEKIPSNILSELLEKTATVKSTEPVNIEGYKIEGIFEVLDKRSDIDRSTLMNLEWLYIPVLDSYSTTRNTEILHNELSNSPEFFVQILKWIYKPERKNELENEEKQLSKEVIEKRAEHAYGLISSWKKIPGMKDDNSIDETELKTWIRKAREIAERESRLEVADMHIGTVLAQYPEDITEWPQETIFSIIEELNSEGINRNYSAALYNKRGSSSRGVFDGGDIERKHAKYFKNLADDYKNKYPNVSKVFSQLSWSYLSNARRMDERAERTKLEY